VASIPRVQSVRNFFVIFFTVNSTVFWGLTPCSSERIPRFGATCHLFLRGRRVSQARNQQNSAYIVLDLLFDPENGSDMLLRNVRLFPNYTGLQPRRPYSRENLISDICYCCSPKSELYHVFELCAVFL
jgi:hypothetical protein